MSIVVEEADETLLWLEIMEETGIIASDKLNELKRETLEILSVFAKARSNTK